MAKTTSNIFWLSVSRAAGLVILFFAYTQLFSYLGPYASGQYQFVLSLVTLFGVVVDLGVSQYVTKKIAEDTSRAAHYFRAFLAAEIVLASLVYGLMVGYVYARGSEAVILHASFVAGLGLFFYGLTVPFLTVMSAFQDLRRVAIINFLAPIVNTALIFTAIGFGFGIVFLAAHQLIFGVLALILYYFFVRRYIPQPKIFSVFRDVDFGLLKVILKASLPFALLVSFATIYNRIDVILIAKFLGYEQTGLYTAAYKIVDLANFFPAAISHSLYPVMAGFMATRAIENVRLMLERYLHFMVMIALPLGVAGSVLAGPLIMVLTSNDVRFAASGGVLAILVWAIAILFIYITANALVISQLTKWAVVITAVNVAVNIIGNIFLLPIIGIKGAAIMTVVSEFLQGVFYFYFIKKYITDFSFFRQFAKPFAASIIMLIVMWPLRSFQLLNVPDIAGARALLPLILNVAIVAGIGGTVYLLTLVALRFFSKEDLGFVRRILRRA